MQKTAKEIVDAMARLSMLALTPEEGQRIAEEWLSMENLWGELAPLRREPQEMLPIHGEGKNLRPDIVGDRPPLGQALANAKATSGPWIAVPKAFEEERP